jgi:maleylpyruvate isomerase
MLKLYDYFRSSACFRVRIALNLKKLNAEVIPIHLLKDGGEQHSTAYQTLNPQALVPTLMDEDKIITQSLAIIEYLEECYPACPLLPNDIFARSWIRSIALSIAADTHPLNNLRVLNYLTDKFQVSEQQKKQWYQYWITACFAALEKKLLMSNFTGDFCFGDQPTLADICIVPQLFNARRFSCDVSAYPTLVRIDDNCQKLSAFSDAFPIESTL